MKFGVLQFPGSCDEVDALHAARRVGDAELIWHGERDLKGADAIVVPGGFSYGDYLRAGAIARFSPAMESVIEFAARRRPGAGDLQRLPGALRGAPAARGAAAATRTCASPSARWTLEVVNAATAFTRACASGERAEHPRQALLGALLRRRRTRSRALEEAGQVVLRYAPAQNFNGSLHDIAGVCNEAGNVFGLMPHPEHAVDELTGGSTDGLRIFESMRLAVEGAHV